VSPLAQLRPAFDLGSYEPHGWALAYWVAAGIVGLLVTLVLGAPPGRDAAARRAFALSMGLLAAVIVTIGAALAAGGEAQAVAVVRVGMAFAAFFGPATLGFACALVGWRASLRAVQGVAWASGAVVAGISLGTDWVIASGWPIPYGWAVRAGFLAPLALLHVFVSLVAALAVLIGRMRASPDPLERRRLRYVVLAYAIGNLAILDLLPLWGIVVVPSLFVWVTTSAFVLSRAMREHGLLGAPDLGLRALGWAACSAIVALPVVAIAGLSGSWGGWGRPIPTTAALVGLGLLVRGHLLYLQPRIDDLFLRRRRDLARELDTLSDKLLVLHTADEIAREVAALCDRALYAKLVVLALREDRGGWRVVRSAWGSVPPPGDDDPFVRHLAGTGRPVLREALGGLFPDAADPRRVAAARLFARYGAEMAVALPSPAGGGEDLPLGLVAIGARPDARPFEALELDFVARLPAAIAAPLSGASLYDRRHRLRQELEEKVVARSTDLARALANLQSAQHQLVQGEKMATLGLVVAGVASELEEAVGAVAAHVPVLTEGARAFDDAAEAVLASLPEGPAGDEVRSWARGAKLDFVRKDVAPLVEAIDEGARRARSIAADLRRFARADVAAIEPADLHRELEATLNLLRHDLKGIRLERDFAPELPLVECDRGPIGQVFLNLVINATQAIEGEGTIRVRTRALDDGGRVEVAVQDTGRGIPPDHLGRIFEPFFTTKALGAKGGTGLGLSISYGIVERHGGRIHVDSEVGKGTEFRVVLPVKAGRRLRAAV
jgi:signal transduction histidine kinase